MARQSRNPGVEGNLILVRAARQLVTLHGPPEPRRGAQMSELAIIPDGALLVRNGVIDSVGTTRRVERLKAAKDAVEVDATGSVVMPAFVDNRDRDLLRRSKTLRARCHSRSLALGHGSPRYSHR